MTDQKDIVKQRTVLVATDLDGTYGRKVSPAPPSAPLNGAAADPEP